jgi:hypothetical protein
MKRITALLIAVLILITACGSGEIDLPKIEVTEPIVTEPPITEQKLEDLFTIDEGFAITEKQEISGDEFDYVVYLLESDERYYYVVIILKDNKVFQVIHREGFESFNYPEIHLIEADVNFDGKNDILLYLGLFGTQALYRFACFLRTDDGFVESPSFAEIPNPVIDSENQVILASIRDGASLYEYSMYRFTDGEFIETDRLTTGEKYIWETQESYSIWLDQVLIDGEWQIREHFTQDDLNWDMIMREENKYWDLSGERWRQWLTR